MKRTPCGIWTSTSSLPNGTSLSLHNWLRRVWIKELTSYLRIRECGRLCFDRCVFIYLCGFYSHNSKSIKPNRMQFGGMIGYYPGTIWLDFGIGRVKGQGHEKVKAAAKVCALPSAVLVFIGSFPLGGLWYAVGFLSAPLIPPCGFWSTDQASRVR